MVNFSSSSSSEESSDEETYTLAWQMFAMAYHRLQHTSTPTRRSINRNREVAHQRLIEDYFSENPLYGEEIFRRRFRLSKELFLRIVSDLEQEYMYFTQSSDAKGRRGFSPL